MDLRMALGFFAALEAISILVLLHILGYDGWM